MNLRELQYFVAVADTGHVGEAAKQCFVSQPTLSVQLQKLESELGVQLFERQQKKLVLSQAGQSLLNKAREILQSVGDLQSEAKTFTDPYGGEFRLGAIPTVCPYLLPKVLPLVKKELPNLNLSIVEQQTLDLLNQLEDNVIDAALLATDEGNDILQAKLLYSEDFYFAIAKENVNLVDKQIDPNSLTDNSLLLLEDGHCLRNQGLDVCGNRSAVANSNFTATSMQTLLALVAAGYGATLVPASIKKYYQSMTNILFLPLKKPVPQRKIYLVSRKSSVRKLCINRLQDIMKIDIGKEKK